MSLKLLFLFFIACEAAKKHEEEKLNTTYDFIIVGAGTSGTVLASRLSEVKNWNILLLEAGEKQTFLNKIPLMAPTLQMLTTSNWNYFTQSQNDFFSGLNNNEMRWPSGKSLGGTSNINYMIYTRGNPHDFNGKWSLPEWTYDKVLPYFKKSESVAPDMDFLNDDYHNRRGPLSVEYAHFGEMATSFLTAAVEMGHNITDYNGKNQLGFSQIQANLLKGERHSLIDAYLPPFVQENRKNLEILDMSHVTKITFDKNNNAKGVKFTRSGRKYRVLMKKEIILCGGTFNTPKLLMLSGVGNTDVINKFNIPPIKHLPAIGQNLQDHITYLGLNFLTNINKSQTDLFKEYLLKLPYWYVSGKGILSSLGGIEALGFIKLPQSPPEQTYPDIELIFANTIINGMIKKIYNIKNELFQKLYENIQTTFSIYPILLHPKSMGNLTLQSKNPKEAPILNPNYLTNEHDQKQMIEAIKFVRKLMETKEFEKFNVKLNPNQIPNCEIFQTDENYWKCALKHLTVTSFDPFGTCKMGLNKQNSVVDQQFKVHYLNKLRIVDASVIPVTISGHLNAICVMLAERAADFIKNEYYH